MEYRIVPAPRRGQRMPGLRGAHERFAATVEDILNDLAAEGWEYVRADALPCDDGRGLFGRGGEPVAMLVFRRATSLADAADRSAPSAAPVPSLGPGPDPDGPADRPPDERSERFARALRAVKGPSAGRRRD